MSPSASTVSSCVAPAGGGQNVRAVRRPDWCDTSPVATVADYLIQYGDVIGYAILGLIALIALGVIQLIRRRRDLERARTAVRLVTYSICEPRQGPVAVTGTYRESMRERW